MPVIRLTVVKKPCKEWEGPFWHNGYGREGQERKHRKEWIKYNGPIPDGKMVLHTCDNPPCYEITHLYLGTHADNMRDRTVRERLARGIRVNTNKLTEEQVYEIRSRYDRGLETNLAIAMDYGITPPMVRYIGIRHSWAWLPELFPCR